MTMRTKGDLCGITVRDEDTYGKISTTNTSRYAGTLITLKITDDRETDTIAQCGAWSGQDSSRCPARHPSRPRSTRSAAHRGRTG